MNFTDLPEGCRYLDLRAHIDARGSFVKPFSTSLWRAQKIEEPLAEVFYSTSSRNVLRGMHFQAPPHAQHKIVHCLSGRILDVLLDLRPGPGYGSMVSLVLNGDEKSAVAMPPGVAHGFLTLSEEATVLYFTTSEHAPEFDRGIRWDGFGFDWPVRDPIVSPRDASFPTLEQFRSPFGRAGGDGADRGQEVSQ
ncbi:MAG: dTDP-4-dehydrorhamnose 3,5-epimerase family protein [Gammaproteobacteria bacterium]